LQTIFSHDEVMLRRQSGQEFCVVTWLEKSPVYGVDLFPLFATPPTVAHWSPGKRDSAGAAASFYLLKEIQPRKHL